MANIVAIVAQIRAAILGKDVRESIASGIEGINSEVITTTGKQDDLETTFEGLIINAGSSNAEIVVARGTFPTLQAREDDTASQIASLASRLREANADIPVLIQTPDGKNQTVHPSVVKFDVHWNGYYYWMSHTPYTNASSVVENPCIACSNDGMVWFTPNGLTNPIDSISSLVGFQSDSELFYNEDTLKLEVWYRETINDATPRYESIYRKTSSDGVTWSVRELLFSNQGTGGGNNGIMSPTVVYSSGIYKIWFVDDNERVIKYYETSVFNSWNFIRDIVISEYDGNRRTWHLNVIVSDLGYEMLIATRTEELYSDQIVYYTKSIDNITYDIPKLLIGKGNVGAWDEMTLYRATFYKKDGIYYIYYSGASVQNEWYIGLTTSKENNNIFSLSSMKNSSGKETVANRIIFNEYSASTITENTVDRYIRYNRMRLGRGTGFAMLEVLMDDDSRLYIKSSDSAILGNVVVNTVQFGAFAAKGTINNGSIKYDGTRLYEYESGVWYPLSLTRINTTAARSGFTFKNGDCYFDTTLGKPTWLKGSNVWVDATGTTV